MMRAVSFRLMTALIFGIFAVCPAAADSAYSQADILQGLKSVALFNADYMVLLRQQELACAKTSTANDANWARERQTFVSEALRSGFDRATVEAIDARIAGGDTLKAGQTCPSAGTSQPWTDFARTVFTDASNGLALTAYTFPLKPRTLDQLDQIKALVREKEPMRIRTERCFQAIAPAMFALSWTNGIAENITVLKMMADAGFPTSEIADVAEILDLKSFLVVPTKAEAASMVDSCKADTGWQEDYTVRFDLRPLEHGVAKILYEVTQ